MALGGWAVSKTGQQSGNVKSKLHENALLSFLEMRDLDDLNKCYSK